jgi:hypothetical protein
MIRLDETGVGGSIHVSVLAYEVALLQDHLDSLTNPNAFTVGVNRAVQAYLMDRIEIITENEGLQHDQK